MQITLEIEESVYNAIAGMCKPLDISVELMLQRLLTQFVVLEATNPAVFAAFCEECAAIPESRDVVQRILKPPS